MDALLQQLRTLATTAGEIWASGGWCMPPLAAVAVLMFALGLNVRLKLSERGFRSVPERVWRRWLDEPMARRGPIGEMLHFVTAARSVAESVAMFEELRRTEVVPFERDLRLMRVCISAAPLLGLLGTVTGMLSTFQALATGAGGDQTMAQIAKGISEALITTEAGLVVALPGVFFQYSLSRYYDHYKLFVAHVETVCTQRLFRRLQAA